MPMEILNYQNLLYETLLDIAPLPPDLWQSILSVVEIKPCLKGRQLYAQLLDLHIVLGGIIIKRWDDVDAVPNDVIDFICKKQYIFHIEHIDGSYFEADCDAVTAYISQKNILNLQEQYPIFRKHTSHFFADILKRRSFRAKLINLQAKERKALFEKTYPEANLYCSVMDKSSFIGVKPSYYSTL